MNRRINLADEGFTLIELVVALAILSLSVAVLFASISSGLAASHRARSETIAASIAQNVLAEAGLSSPLEPGVRTGSVGDYAWQLNVQPYQSATEEDAASRPAAAIVDIIVSWRDGLRERRVKVSTLRIMPRPR